MVGGKRREMADTVGWEPNILLILEATGRDRRLESKPDPCFAKVILLVM